jgi:hypothetical protein
MNIPENYNLINSLNAYWGKYTPLFDKICNMDAILAYKMRRFCTNSKKKRKMC